MNNGMTRLLPLTLIAIIVLFGGMYFTSSMSSLDAGTDVSGSNYEGAYDATTNTTITTLSIISLIMYLIGAAALIAALWMMKSAYEGN
jgi:cellobiose-specific phosphotransferase system component IIC